MKRPFDKYAAAATPGAWRRNGVLVSIQIAAVVLATNRLALAEPEASDDNSSEDSAEEMSQTESVAREHFLRGVSFYKSGDTTLALGEFRRSYELSRNYRVLYNIGLVNLELNRYADALVALEAYLREGGNDISEDRRADVAADVADLKAKVARIEVVLNVDQAAVLIDGVSHGDIRRRRFLVLDPGEHQIEVRADKHEPRLQRLSLVAGERTRIEIVLKESTQVLARPRGETAVAPVEAPKKRPLWIGWVATGALAAGAATTGVLATTRANRLADLRNEPGSSTAERDGVRVEAQRLALIADIAAGATVAAAGTTLFFTLRKPRHESPPERRGASARLGIHPSGVAFELAY